MTVKTLWIRVGQIPCPILMSLLLKTVLKQLIKTFFCFWFGFMLHNWAKLFNTQKMKWDIMYVQVGRETFSIR
jgi:hypothetical protein